MTSNITIKFTIVIIGLMSSCTAEQPDVVLNGRLVVLNKRADTAFFVDLATTKVTHVVKTGKEPHELAISSDEHYIAISNYKSSSITLIDPVTYKTREIQLRPGTYPHGCVFIPETYDLLVTAEGVNELILVDVEMGQVIKRLSTDQHKIHRVVVSPTGDRAFCSNFESGSVSSVNLDLWEWEHTVPCGKGAEGMAVTPDGSELWVTNREENTISILETATLKEQAKLDCKGNPLRIQITPDGEQVLVVNSMTNTISVFDIASRTLIHTIKLKGSSTWLYDLLTKTPRPVGLALHPSGRYAFVTASNADELLILDLSAYTLVDKMTVGDLPDGVAFLD